MQVKKQQLDLDMEQQTGSKSGKEERGINNLRYADDTTHMAESEEELKSLLWKWKWRVKSWLKAQHSENKDHSIWSLGQQGDQTSQS